MKIKCKANWTRYLLKTSVTIITTTGLLGTLKSTTAQIPANQLGQQLLQQTSQCIKSKFTDTAPSNLQALQTASMQCVLQVTMLAEDGSIRPDASDRITALVAATGVSLPQPVSQGQANIPLKLLPNTNVFTLPVQIGGQSKTFLLDTGASASIINNETATQLKLQGTPVPNDFIKYLVVGNDCSKVQASFHSLPLLAVNKAQVQGLFGIGMGQNSIPVNTSGVLGLDFLSNFDVVINPKKLQLQLLPPSPPVTGAIPLQGKLGNMIAQAKINGQGPFNFLLDTGAETTVISKSLAKKLKIDQTKLSKTEVNGFCGTEKAQKIKLSQLNLQQHQATLIDAVILESDNIFNVLGIQGIIGQNVLNRYQQHWRFGKRNPLGYTESGSLVLIPVSKK
ncbi:retropepsin-like aspartic protease [Fischerella sp. JS2]|uniref:retropepsin-like aspartic protease n=1 Tax=Fischerella sp. JS2 TaxID=2597771 RepID=UPI0028E65E48|nr:retropepsin-like aspartic protease [Fischerella sp. JS2]